MSKVLGILARRVYFSSGLYLSCSHRSKKDNEKIFGKAINPHGNNYTLEAFVEGPIQKDTGLIINVKKLDEMMKKVILPLDHHFLNEDVPEFKKENPTLENLSKYCYKKLNKELPSFLKLIKVRLYENEDLWMDYTTRTENHL